MADKKTKIEKAGDHVIKISSVVSAMIVIIGAMAALSSWASAQLSSAISSQLDVLKEEVKQAEEKTELQITRLELINLMTNQPENKAEIEKVAKYYFKTLDGDWYVTGIYSEWADKHNGDISIIIGKD